MMKPARRRKDKPVYAFVRRGNMLCPDMDMDLRALDGVPQNGLVYLDIRKPRNPARLRAYWAMLNEVVAATDCAPTPEQLHEIIKLELQFVDLIRLPNGVTIALPGSVAFEAMTEHEFINFFQRAEEWLARTYGYVKEQAA